MLQNGLSLSGIPTYWQQIVTGIILVAAVLGDRMQNSRVRIRPRPTSQTGHPEPANVSS